MINLLRTIHSFFVTSNCYCTIDKIPKFSQKKEIVEVLEVDINIIKKEDNSYCRNPMNFKKVLEASFAPW